MSGGNPKLVYACEQWEIDLGRRELRSGGTPVPLGSRAFEIVEVLVQSASELVTKDQLMDRVWRGTIVGEGTLHVHISAVRKALGADRSLLKTSPGRGYRLLGSWTSQQREATAAPATSPLMRATGAPPANNFPPVITRLVGRSEACQLVRDLVSAYRVVTLTGPGGIGKTSLAIKAVRYLLPDFEDGGWIVELASLSDPNLVPSTVASTLGLRLGGDKISAEAVARAVGTKHLFLVLDNCEHLVEAVAHLADAFVHLCPHTTLLATSREILRIDGETVYRVPPLDVPAEEQEAPDRILNYSAVELFIARTKSLDAGFSPRREDLASIGAICRRLSGIPLAIEFAAARAAMLGVQEVATGLHNRFALLTAGRRNALPRHRTLRAALDWSYELLPAEERRLFRYLAVFHGGFTLDAAVAVLADRGLNAAMVTSGIANLVAKSLVALDTTRGATRWYLLETIRAYALEKLTEHGEASAVAARHAAYFRDLITPLASGASSSLSDEDLTLCIREIDNLRAALDWAFSSAGDGSLGVALTNAAFPLWMRLSLLEECRGRTQQALRTSRIGENQDSRELMRLHAALGASTSDPSEMDTALVRTLEIARSLDDIEYQLRALRGLVFRYVSTNPYRALPHAQAFHDLSASRSDSHDRLFGECLIAAAKHYIGDQASARRHLEQALSSYPPVEPGREIMSYQDIIRFGTHLWVMAHVWRGRVLWLQGLADQAVRATETGIEEALATAHAPSLCYALGLGACQVDLWVGNLDAAEDHTRMLLDHSRKHGLLIWEELGAKFQSVIDIKRDKFNSGPHLLPAGQGETVRRNFNFLLLLSEVTAARWPSPAGPQRHSHRSSEGADLSEANWLTPELFRLKGERLLAQRTSGAAETAEKLFRQAQDEARRQGALSWELRAATSLAGLLRGPGRSADAIACLQPIYDRFSEGFGTADLVAAKQLLDELSAPDRG